MVGVKPCPCPPQQPAADAPFPQALQRGEDLRPDRDHPQEQRKRGQGSGFFGDGSEHSALLFVGTKEEHSSSYVPVKRSPSVSPPLGRSRSLKGQRSRKNHPTAYNHSEKSNAYNGFRDGNRACGEV